MALIYVMALLVAVRWRPPPRWRASAPSGTGREPSSWPPASSPWGSGWRGSSCTSTATRARAGPAGTTPRWPSPWWSTAGCSWGSTSSPRSPP
ncbi:hypothetical protein AAFF_G00323770 [Aldrovandia affinis]|uniref:Uncharacterized protein n=1 Tax=Aldrovandia affinis TaxID=143900 RepID=A0AAD7R974_9TELE|nr:hypothetical protein AAFF_G00323770 [Aldrovandia affinis]